MKKRKYCRNMDSVYCPQRKYAVSERGTRSITKINAVAFCRQRSSEFDGVNTSRSTMKDMLQNMMSPSIAATLGRSTGGLPNTNRYRVDLIRFSRSWKSVML